MVPNAVASLRKAKIDVVVEQGAGIPAGYPDEAYEAVGVKIGTRADVFASDVVAFVRTLGANAAGLEADLASAREGQLWIGMTESLAEPEATKPAAAKGIKAFSLELIPRITRAQSMDVLSSQANLAGYKAVLLGAAHLPKVLPMMTTAAGTITPARVLIIGVGVAGLQAIATARRLGAVVSAYDVRPETKQQVESLGARFVELDLETGAGEGGYAKAMDEEFYRKQRELMAKVCAESDMVVTTAAVPGKKAPILVTTAMVDGMHPGSVVVDIAAEKGGNCELTKAGETFEYKGVSIIGPVGIPSTLAFHASALYAKNVATFLLNMVNKEGALNLNLEDPIIKDTLLTDGGKIVNERVLQLLGEVSA